MHPSSKTNTPSSCLEENYVWSSEPGSQFTAQSLPTPSPHVTGTLHSNTSESSAEYSWQQNIMVEMGSSLSFEPTNLAVGHHATTSTNHLVLHPTSAPGSHSVDFAAPGKPYDFCIGYTSTEPLLEGTPPENGSIWSVSQPQPCHDLQAHSQGRNSEPNMGSLAALYEPSQMSSFAKPSQSSQSIAEFPFSLDLLAPSAESSTWTGSTERISAEDRSTYSGDQSIRSVGSPQNALQMPFQPQHSRRHTMTSQDLPSIVLSRTASSRRPSSAHHVPEAFKPHFNALQSSSPTPPKQSPSLMHMPTPQTVMSGSMSRLHAYAESLRDAFDAPRNSASDENIPWGSSPVSHPPYLAPATPFGAPSSSYSSASDSPRPAFQEIPSSKPLTQRKRRQSLDDTDLRPKTRPRPSPQPERRLTGGPEFALSNGILPNRKKGKGRVSAEIQRSIQHVHALNIQCPHPTCTFFTSGAASTTTLEESDGFFLESGKNTGKKRKAKKAGDTKGSGKQTKVFVCLYLEPLTGVECTSSFRRRACRDRHSASHSGRESKVGYISSKLPSLFY